MPDYFKVWAKDGQILTFGQTADSRVQAYRLRRVSTWPSRRWCGRRVRPGDGAWAAEPDRGPQRQRRPPSSTRGRGGDAAGLWCDAAAPVADQLRAEPVGASSSTRTGRITIDGFAGGAHTRTASVSRIAMWGGPQGGTAELLREYRLSLRATSITGRSLLSQVTECDRDGACQAAGDVRLLARAATRST